MTGRTARGRDLLSSCNDNQLLQFVTWVTQSRSLDHTRPTGGGGGVFI